MALRADTTLATLTGTAWSPTDECVLQAKFEDPKAVVVVQARVHTDADWTTIYRFSANATPFQRLAKLPFMRIFVEQNTAGKSVKVWDNV